MMDETESAEGAKIHLTETEASARWAEAQQSLAAATGLSILLVAGHQPPALAVSNNNSICRAFQSSLTHAHLCEPYCGQAYQRAMEAGAEVRYRCHAGLHCFAKPIELATGQRPVAIGGRAFFRSVDYQVLAERFRSGDLRSLLAPELFQNVIFASRQRLDQLAIRIVETAANYQGTSSEISDTTEEPSNINATSDTQNKDTKGAEETWKHYFSPGVRLKEACCKAVDAFSQSHGINYIALMLRANGSFIPLCVTGLFKKNLPRLSFNVKEIKALQAATTTGESIAMPAEGHASHNLERKDELFPLVVGDELKGALLVREAQLSAAERHMLSDFCREIALPLEVLRLREDLERRTRAATHLQALTRRINAVEPEEAYTTILRHSAELLRAERGSLLLFDERAKELAVKAAVGPRAEIAREARMRLGDGVSGSVLSEGRPLIVNDEQSAGWNPAPAERSYKTSSFISYPIIIGGRKVGVLNVTDKAGGGSYDESDLGLLDMLVPQMALALDRAEWYQKATQFELLSITDPLTGLLNRRYLEERLSEELERSKRHRFSMCFMMVDIDDFKDYNDQHGHQAGDLALEMTAKCLKSALRSADIASRYGGEEFCVLLPQTNLSEAHVIAERIRRRIEQMNYPHDKSQPLGAVTVSIGIAAYGLHLDTPASIIYAADQALYAAKSHGKNHVDSFSPVTPLTTATGVPANDADRES